MVAAKVALVTGANSGIGFAIVKALAAAPEVYHVILAGRDPKRLDTAIEEIKATGLGQNGLTPVQLDVTNQDSILKAASFVEDKFGHLDVLINNAGIAPEGPDTAEIFHSIFQTNVTGPVLVSTAFRPLLLRSKVLAPYTVYIGSVTSSLTYITDPKSHLHNTSSGSNAYRASKAALNHIVMHEQIEVAGTPLRPRIMCPGFVVSNLRGTSEAARSGGGRAGDPANSARLLLSILRGEQEAHAASLIGESGPIPW